MLCIQVFHQGMIFQCPPAVGGEKTDLVITADKDGIPVIDIQGTDCLIRHFGYIPSRAIVRQQPGLVADIEDTPGVLEKRPV